MTQPIARGPHWTTSSFGHVTQTSPLDLLALGEHLDLCRGARGRLFEVRSAAQRVHGFVVARSMTALIALVAIISAAMALL
jgi:hypothetical protein